MANIFCYLEKDQILKVHEIGTIGVHFKILFPNI